MLHSTETTYFWSHVVSVECWTQRCYCELVTNVVYNNVQDTLVYYLHLAVLNLVYQVYLGAIQRSREYKKFHTSISIHFNCSFMPITTTNLWSQQLLGVY